MVQGFGSLREHPSAGTIKYRRDAHRKRGIQSTICGIGPWLPLAISDRRTRTPTRSGGQGRRAGSSRSAPSPCAGRTPQPRASSASPAARPVRPQRAGLKRRVTQRVRLLRAIRPAVTRPKDSGSNCVGQSTPSPCRARRGTGTTELRSRSRSGPRSNPRAPVRRHRVRRQIV